MKPQHPPLQSPQATAETRKREHAVFMLPIFGWLLIIPPLVTLFTGSHRLFGIPLDTIYLFSVWLLLILGAGATSLLMPRAEIVPRDDDIRGER